MMKEFASPPLSHISRHPGATGFTLVEILAAMFVLSVGLASVAMIVITSTRTGAAASDRNNAAVIIPEAMADIERMMLIPTTSAPNPMAPFSGELMDTLNLGGYAPGAGPNPFDSVPITVQDPSGAPQPSISFSQLACPSRVDKYSHLTAMPNLAFWPLDLNRSRVMGQYPVGLNANPLVSSTGLAYRGLFKLEPHPDWFNGRPPPVTTPPTPPFNDASPFAGVYVLTFTLYRDLDPGKAVTNPKKRLIQVSDPVIKYLKDKALR